MSVSRDQFEQPAGRWNWVAWLVRIRVQFAGAFVFAVMLPVVVRSGGDIDKWFLPEQFNTILAASAAILIGLVVLRQVTVFPGIRETYYVAPIMMISFVVVLAVMLFLRVDYNRYHFPIALVITIIWVFVGFSVSEPFRRGRFAIVPSENANSMQNLDAAHWEVLTEPKLPTRHFDGLVLDLRSDLSDEWERFVADCALAGIRVFHYRQLQESIQGRVEIHHLSENTLGSINPNAGYMKLKQAIDWVVALFAVLLLLPLALGLVVAIRLDSRGSAIFRQRRVGFRGKQFTVYKFRTMVDLRHDASAEGAETLEVDPRITRLGRFLRRTRIDELPQLINVLRGEMSIIGPRPEAVVLSERYEAQLPYYRYRHIVRPGITGWAQVNQGHVTDLSDVLEKLNFDFYYIKNYSPWLDVVIVLRTVAVMITGSGSR